MWDCLRWQYHWETFEAAEEEEEEDFHMIIMGFVCWFCYCFIITNVVGGSGGCWWWWWLAGHICYCFLHLLFILFLSFIVKALLRLMRPGLRSIYFQWWWVSIVAVVARSFRWCCLPASQPAFLHDDGGGFGVGGINVDEPTLSGTCFSTRLLFDGWLAGWLAGRTHSRLRAKRRHSTFVCQLAMPAWQLLFLLIVAVWLLRFFM